MESEINQDLKAKMKAALSRKMGAEQELKSEIHEKTNKKNGNILNLSIKKIHRRKTGSQ